MALKVCMQRAARHCTAAALNCYQDHYHEQAGTRRREEWLILNEENWKKRSLYQAVKRRTRRRRSLLLHAVKKLSQGCLTNSNLQKTKGGLFTCTCKLASTLVCTPACLTACTLCFSVPSFPLVIGILAIVRAVAAIRS